MYERIKTVIGIKEREAIKMNRGATKQEAINKWFKDNVGRRGDFVYQSPAGHWACCTPDSPVGKALVESGYIYPETGCKAQTWEVISIDDRPLEVDELDFCAHCGSNLVQLVEGQPRVCEASLSGDCYGDLTQHSDHSDRRVCQGIGCEYGDH